MNFVSHPKIRKARKICGKTLIFRNATEFDAEFILSLRRDEIKSRYISPTSDGLDSQLAWLKNYSTAEDQAYFIIYFNDEAIGTVRIYDCVEDDFSWGSWIISANAPGHAAIESALILYAYALDFLKFKKSHFSVHKLNKSVCRFHERFGAIKLSENQEDIIYAITESAIEKSREKYHKFLPEKIVVEYLI